MKKVVIVRSMLALLLGLWCSFASHAQLGNLKKAAEKAAGGKTPAPASKESPAAKPADAAGSVAQNLPFPVPESELKALSQKYMLSYYGVREFPGKDMGPVFWKDQLRKLEAANIEWLRTETARDRKAYPVLFAYYGMEEKGRYGDLPYGGNKAAPWSGKSDEAGTVNMYIREIFEFLEKFKGSDKLFAETVQAAINDAEQAMAKDKVEKATYAYDWFKWVQIAQPQNPFLPDLEREAVKTLNRALASIDHLMTGDMHRKNLRRLVGFARPQQAGKENAADISYRIEAGKPLYLIGYFQTDMKSTGGVPTLIIKHFDEEYKEKKAKRYAENQPKTWLQPMYVPASVKTETEQRGYFEFALFPDMATLNYESHLQYIPHLNFAKWVSALLPGEYELELSFGLRTTMAANPFVLVVTPEGKEAARRYYDQLYAKKVDAVTFPMAGCQNRASSIPNVSDLAKYGKLLKLDYSATGNIMFPWPRDKEVQFNTAAGYGVFEKDGKTQVIHLEFRKTPSAGQFSFHSIGKIPSDLEMQCPNQATIKPEILDFGYEMRARNVDKCKPW